MVGYILVLAFLSGPSKGQEAVFFSEGAPHVFLSKNECETKRNHDLKLIAEQQKKSKDVPKASLTCKKVSVTTPEDNNTGPLKKSGI